MGALVWAEPASVPGPDGPEGSRQTAIAAQKLRRRREAVAIPESMTSRPPGAGTLG